MIGKNNENDQNRGGVIQEDDESPNTEQVVEEIEEMPPEKREAVVAAFQFSGPLPPAKELQAYEDIEEGTADRIIRMAEKQAEHRRAQEKRMVESACGDSRVGLWLGFVIGMSALLLSGIIALMASTTAGSLLAFSSITSLVAVFVYGSKQNSEYSPGDQEQGNDGND